jgi:PadR family transcriptional regulator, regulatory protein PadR
MLIQILHGTLDLMILRPLASMGPQHAYAIANRLQQISDDALNRNQGTIYPALVRVEQQRLDSWLLGQNGKRPRSEVSLHHQGGVEGAR